MTAPLEKVERQRAWDAWWYSLTRAQQEAINVLHHRGIVSKANFR